MVVGDTSNLKTLIVMNKKENNIVFRSSWFKTLKRYTPEMVVEFLNALESYSNNEPVEIHNDRVMDLWEQAEPLLDSDNQKYLKRVEINRQNGKKGGAPNGNTNASKTTENNPIQPKTTEGLKKQPKQTIEKEIEIEREIDNDIDIETDIEIENETENVITDNTGRNLVVDCDFTWTEKDYKTYWNKGYTIMFKGEVVKEQDVFDIISSSIFQ